MHHEKRIRAASLLVIAGLVIELISLRWAHPTAFIVFAAGTGISVGAAIVLVLTVLLGSGPQTERDP